jgi:hypothetical protein
MGYKRIVLKKVNSIADLDSIMVTMHHGRLKPRKVIELFNNYYSDEKYVPNRIPLDELVGAIIPYMQELVELAPKLFKGVELVALGPRVAANLALTRPQVACIVAMMWFNLFDYDYFELGEKTLSIFPEPTLAGVFLTPSIFSLQCILGYFKRVKANSEEPLEERRAVFAATNVIYKRAVLQQEPRWLESQAPIIAPKIVAQHRPDDIDTRLSIVSSRGMVGSELCMGQSMTHEYIALLVRPECLPALLLCGDMMDGDSIVILGAERMSEYKGYGAAVLYLGHYDDPVQLGFSANETEAMAQCGLVFIDASSRAGSDAQFVDDFSRDLLKAYCGFSSVKFTRPAEQVSAQHWAYDGVGNNIQLKFIQLLVAASEADKQLVYCTQDIGLAAETQKFVDWLTSSKYTVRDLVSAYVRFVAEYQGTPGIRLNDHNLFECIQEIE